MIGGAHIVFSGSRIYLMMGRVPMVLSGLGTNLHGKDSHSFEWNGESILR